VRWVSDSNRAGYVFYSNDNRLRVQPHFFSEAQVQAIWGLPSVRGAEHRIYGGVNVINVLLTDGSFQLEALCSAIDKILKQGR
jgi:hypothetical protein